MSTQRSVYTVDQVNSYIHQMFSADPFLTRIYVKGEISNCKYHSSGHIYFSLKDELAQVNCIMFAGNRKKLNFRLEDGQKVIVFGSMGVYEKGGSYQLYASAIRLDGIGALYERFEALKSELSEMGMFDQMYKKPIPHYIKRLGVVTAPTGAAVRDIINVSKRRNPGIEILLYPALVQGEGASQSVARGIRLLDSHHVDTIIVGRGGGSIEDLWAFNERVVAEAIFNASTPIISAVGHETDFTIADYVADLRAPTPSAAAELAVDDMVSIRAGIEQDRVRLRNQMMQKCAYVRREAEGYRLRLQAKGPAGRLRERMMQLENLQERMTNACRARVDSAREAVRALNLDLKMKTKIRETENQLRMAVPPLKAAMRQRLQGTEGRYKVLEAKVRMLSPQDHLNRGYAFVADSRGRAVQSVSSLVRGELLNITLKDGSLDATVQQIRPEGLQPQSTK